MPRFPYFAAPLLLATSATAPVRAQSAQPSWGPLAKLVAVWTAAAGAGGQPGTASTGGESWAYDLGGRVIVRRNFSEYPAAAGRPAFRHDGLTVIAPAPNGGFVAHDFDNEGHLIDYVVAATDTAVVFTSAPDRSSPRFRLTYRPAGDGYAIEFEIAPPGQPSAFKSYVSGTLHKR